MKTFKPLLILSFLMLTVILNLSAKENAGAFFITTIQSIENGMRIEAIMTISGGSYINVYRRDKEDIFTGELSDWSVIQDAMTPMDEDGNFFFIDSGLELGHEYCYKLELIMEPQLLGIESWPLCEFFDGNMEIARPLAPSSVGVIQATSSSLRVRFRDQSDNEDYFFLEIREPILPNQPEPNPGWRPIAINEFNTLAGRSGGTSVIGTESNPGWRIIAWSQSTAGTGLLGSMDANNLEMERRYCFRVRSINSSGSSLSNITCFKTTPIELSQFRTLNQEVILPKIMTHPSPNSLEFEWFDSFREHKARIVTLYEMEDLDRVVTFQMFNVNTSTPVPSTHKVLFSNLDPKKEYCATVDSEILPFDNKSICESPFGVRTFSSDNPPEISTIGEIVRRSGHLRLNIINPMEGQLIDMTRKDNGQRRTLRGARDGRSTIELNLQGGKEYCFRMFRTNEFGTRYSRSMCAMVPSSPPIFPGTGTGSGNGQEVVHPNKIAGVDCDCSETGEFIDPIPPSTESSSSDGVYRVTKTANSVSVFRNTDNVRVFNENNLSNGFQSGFGPQSRYFLLAAPQGINRVSVGVHDLEGASSDNRSFFDSNVLNDAGWGFSPDGRSFLLARETSVSAYTLNLVNLDTRESETISYSSSFSAFWQFSPCGDAFVVVNQANATVSGNLNLYTTIDLEEVIHNLLLESDYTGIVSNNSNHVASRPNGATQIISPNTAIESCQIPIRDGGIYDLQMVRFPNTSISDSEADQLFGEATDFITTSNSQEDVACAITFNRVGSILVNTSGDGSIDDASEELAAFLAPGQVKLVNRINFCGTMRPALGCAPVPGRSFIFTKEEDEVTTFVHEFGHNRGLEHDSDPNSLMYEYGGSQAINISQNQCNAFKGLSAFIVGDGPLASNQPVENISIEEFVRRSYFEGVPFDKVQEYGSTVVPQLLEMLKDQREKPHWSNIVVTLGMIGDIKAFDPMVAFIEKNSPIQTEQHYNARTNAILSLGYLLNATNNDRILDYLKNSLSPDIWNKRKIEGTAKYQSNAAERNLDYSKYAIFGLALAGTPKAKEVLETMSQPITRVENSIFQLKYSNVIRSALIENEKIHRQGLKKYYSKNKTTYQKAER